MQSRKNTGVIILVAALLLAVMFMDIWMVFKQTRQQTRDSGIYQLESISGELEGTIGAAKNLTGEIAIAAREYINNEAALEQFIYGKKSEILSMGIGAFNVYMAGTGWDIIPDFEKPDTYVATERSWYVGAVRNGGKPYVTAPYQDAMTGEICYTVSIMLGDGDTVCALDYKMDTIQEHIAQMYKEGSHEAVIVTDEGIIAGCSDETLIGKNLLQALPDYAGIWSLARSSEGVVTARIKADFLYDNLFAAKSGNGWYLIVSESDWNLYQNSYIQLVITIMLSLALFAIIIILYLLAVKNGQRVEDALASKEAFLSGITGELRDPLTRILDSSSKENEENIEDYSEEMARIHAYGESLSEMIGQIISYNSIVRTENKDRTYSNFFRGKEMNKHFRTVILTFMTLVMLISLYSNLSVAYQWGNELMQSQAKDYEYQLSEWINTQKSILDMFVSTISTNPEMLEDYDATIAYLNRITVQYPEISVTYMTNPNLEHTVYMNNGWEPEPDWHVEERQWYKDTMASDTGWSISAPYYDEQTGGYCVTVSERVYDAKTGEFLGCFGIDFFMDKLVKILGDSYSDLGYAFLVDTQGYIINHPYGSYQMTQEEKANVSGLPYGEVKADGKSTQMIRDYDGTYRILIAARNDASKFTVYVVTGVWWIYGRVVIYGLIGLITFLVCIILVYRLLTDLIHRQDETNRQMKEAADAAIEAGKAKSQFLAQMSHEIRTPINAVLGMNEMILREASDESILDYAGNIQTAGKNLLGIINSILDFSKIEDGKMKILPVKYDLASVINNLVLTIEERAKAKSLEFIVEVDEKLPSILLGDDMRLTQVIMNLLTNAVKYTDEGKITLSIQEGKRDADSVLLNVKVVDTGIGIRKEDMEKLFESFERLEETRNRNIEGTGLGMAIVIKLLRMMDSELQVQSEYGSGSMFSFEIRQSIVDAQPIGDYAKRLEKGKEQRENEMHLYVPDARVLVVDDNEMNRKVARNLMKLNGFVPDMASSGAEAIEMIRKKTYDIVFLDHMMPKLDGLETLAKLKEENLIPVQTSVIALTANAVSGAKETYLSAGFDDYLPKPIEVWALEDKLKAYIPAERLGKPQEEEIMEFFPKEEDGIWEFAPGGEECVETSHAQEKCEGDTCEPERVIFAMSGTELDVEEGLRYCGNDIHFYLEMLRDYIGASEEKCRVLNDHYDKQDWHEYRIQVHALKSTSKMVGAMQVFEPARALEEAAAREDASFIQAHHKDLLVIYAETVESIRKAFAG